MQIKSQPYSEFTVKLLIANFLCQLMVVGVHHFGGIINSLAATGHPLEDHQTANAVIGFMYVLAIGFGTVLFFVLAGYLFFNGYEKDGAWARKVKSRLFSIGLPYVVWNFLASPWFTALLIPLFALFMPSVGTPRSCSFNEVFIGQYPAFYPANGPLWFLRELLLMTLASPLIYRMLKSRLAIYWVGATLGAWMLAASFCYGGIENITQAMFGFSLGGYWKVSGRQLFGFSPRQAIGGSHNNSLRACKDGVRPCGKYRPCREMRCGMCSGSGPILNTGQDPLCTGSGHPRRSLIFHLPCALHRTIAHLRQSHINLQPLIRYTDYPCRIFNMGNNNYVCVRRVVDFAPHRAADTLLSDGRACQKPILSSSPNRRLSRCRTFPAAPL